MKFQSDTDNKFDLKIMHQCRSFLRNVLMIRCSYCKKFIVILIIVVHICLVFILNNKTLSLVIHTGDEGGDIV